MSIGKGSRIILEDLYLIDLGEKYTAYDTGMKNLAHATMITYRKFWELIKKDHPELDGWILHYEWKTREITVVRESTPEEESP